MLGVNENNILGPDVNNVQEITRSVLCFLLSALPSFSHLEKLGSFSLEVEKIALTERKQRLKLAIILKTVSSCLQLEESELKWSVDGTCRTQH